MDIHDPRTQRFLLIGVVAATLIYVYFFGTFLPFGHRAMSAERQELEQEFQSLSADLSKARQTLSDRAEIERQYEILGRRWDVASDLLPEEREVADLLRQVTLVGRQAGVEFLLFKPRPMMIGEVYNENPVDVQVIGGYHQVGSFLSEVANMERIVNIANLKLLEVVDEKASQTVKAVFSATAYTLSENLPPRADRDESNEKGDENEG